MKTYQDLKKFLNSLSEEQLQKDITFCDKQEEYYGIKLKGEIEDEADVLDENSPYLIVNFEIVI